MFANPAWWQVKGGLQFLWDINISHLHLAVMILLCTLQACVGIANVVASERRLMLEARQVTLLQLVIWVLLEIVLLQLVIWVLLVIMLLLLLLLLLLLRLVALQKLRLLLLH